MFQLLVAGAAAKGVLPSALLGAAELSPEDLLDPDARLPIASELRLWREAVRLSGDDDLGLHLAEGAQVGDFGGLGFAVRSSKTLVAGYERVIRFLHLVNGEVGLRLFVEGERVRLEHLPPSEARPPRQAVECLLGMLVMIGKRNLGDAFFTQAVHFRHAPPARIDTHRRVFGGTLRFAQPRDELILDRQLLAQPLPQAEPELAELLDRHLSQLISALPQGPGFLDRVRSCVAQELRHGEPGLQDVAQRLHMSGRSLQRRLQQEGTTLQELLAGVRRDLAVRHLHDAQESIAEIAFLLGFSEVSTFHRAFKRWTGLTPSAYRRRSIEKAAR